MSKQSISTVPAGASKETLREAMRQHDEVQTLLRKVKAIGRVLEACNGDDLTQEEVSGIGECLTDFADRAKEQTQAAHRNVGDVWREMGGAR